jgi:uncharacterized protein (TIGR00730 family)
MKSICVFCGSRFGAKPSYRAAAERLGELAARAGLDMIYGGGHVGLMGAAADAARRAGGQVIGFIPDDLLRREVGHDKISELVVTDTMSARKDLMIERADAFAVLPGGMGTLDEFFEVLTLRQLGYHDKPMVLINIEGFWDPLLTMMKQIIETDFAGDNVYSMISSVDDVEGFFPAIGVSLPSSAGSGEAPSASLPRLTEGMA